MNKRTNKKLKKKFQKRNEKWIEKMNKNIIQIGGVIGILAILFSLCAAVPKYESASSKRYALVFLVYACLTVSSKITEFLFSSSNKCPAQWKWMEAVVQRKQWHVCSSNIGPCRTLGIFIGWIWEFRKRKYCVHIVCGLAMICVILHWKYRAIRTHRVSVLTDRWRLIWVAFYWAQSLESVHC